MKNYLVFALLLLTIISFSSCSTDYKSQDDALLQQYIKDNNLTAIKVTDGLYYTMDIVGTGLKPTSRNSIVTVNYTGRRLDGFQFDSSIGRGPFTSSLSAVIKGWEYGIQYYNVGGKGKLLIPSHLAYGENGSGSDIPPNTPIVFDVELLAVQN